MKEDVLTIEEWRPVTIEGFEEIYQVSNLGRVKSLNYGRTGKPQVLKAGKGSRGYLFVNLCKDGKVKNVRVHKLVAEAFLGECPEGMEVDHINTVRTDNRVENLRYVTRSQNMWNPITRERVIEAVKENLKKAVAVAKEKQTWKKAQAACMKPVVQYSKDRQLLATFPSATEAARSLGKEWAFANISACAKGKHKTAYGFIWEYT